MSISWLTLWFSLAINATDGLSVWEFRDGPRYAVQGLYPLRTHPTYKDGFGHNLPNRLFVTSPNMASIPDISKDPFPIQVRADGRFATSDFTLFPQWYAEGTYYLPYVRRKPTVDNDPYAVMWHQLSKEDFIKEGAVGGMGKLSDHLASTFADLRRDLMAKIREVAISGRHTREELKELHFCERGMHLSSVSLICAVQSYEGILLTATSFQRYFLETLACYEYLTYWKNLPVNDSNKPRPLAHVMGALTVEVEIAVRLFDEGVPVWLARHPSCFPLSTILLNEVSPTVDEMELKLLAGSAVIWAGEAGAFRNRVCQSLRMANINLGHSAYRALPGRFVTVANQGWFFISKFIKLH